MNFKFIYKVSIILFLLTSFLLSGEFYVNPYYLHKIKKDSRSYRIIEDYVRFLNSIKNKDYKTKLTRVNSYINQLNSHYDAYTYNKDEYWATPFEFLSNQGGDCEDYVIAKMYSLERLGISKKKMYLSAVKEKYIGGDHMVLSVSFDDNKPPLVLDNLSTKVLPIDKRVDLKLIFMFNEYGFYNLINYNKLIERKKIDIQSYENFKHRFTADFIIIR